MKVRILVALVAFSLLPRAGGAQVPPPPSLPGQDALAERLVGAIEAKNVPAYAALLSDGLRVFEDGKEVAGSKTEWLTTYGPKLAAEGVLFKVGPAFSSSGRLLFVEYVNSTASWGGRIPAHCCWSHDAVAYDLVDGKITVIRRLKGGDKAIRQQGESVP